MLPEITSIAEVFRDIEDEYPEGEILTSDELI
jgi:hypothetical protein